MQQRERERRQGDVRGLCLELLAGSVCFLCAPVRLGAGFTFSPPAVQVESRSGA